MAGTNVKKKRSVTVNAGRQASANAWTPDQLLAVFDDRTDAQRIAALKNAGIVDSNGRLTKLYKSWGDKVTRTPEAGE